jgi:hypothetical protein
MEGRRYFINLTDREGTLLDRTEIVVGLTQEEADAEHSATYMIDNEEIQRDVCGEMEQIGRDAWNVIRYHERKI